MEIMTRKIKRNWMKEKTHPLTALPFYKHGHCKKAGNQKRKGRGK